MRDILDILSSYGCTVKKVANTDGGEFSGACPFCGGKDRFRVWPNSNNGRYWCRKCDRKGDAIDFVREMDNLNFQDACKVVGKELQGMEKKKRTQINKKSWEIKNHEGQLIATHYRIDFDDGSKEYPWERLGKPGLSGLPTSMVPLYGSEKLKDYELGDIVIVEGEKTADSLLEKGFKSLGTVCGANIIPDKSVLEPLVGKNCNIILWPDNDNIGKKHMDGISSVLRDLGIEAQSIQIWPSAKEKDDAVDYIEAGLDVQKILDESTIHRTSPYYPPSYLLGNAYDYVMCAINGERQEGFLSTGFDKLDDKIDGWGRFFNVICARAGLGKCLGKGTKVLMYDGSLKCVEDIKIGDMLMGPDSTPRNVLSVSSGVEQMYWVHQNKGISYRVNESHILSLKVSYSKYISGTNKGDVVNISLKDYMGKNNRFKKAHKGYRVPIEFPKKEVPIDPYLLGIWLGDGSSNDSRIYNVDHEIINYIYKISSIMGMTVGVTEFKGRVNGYCIKELNGGQNGLKSILRKFNLLNNKHIPKMYLVNSRDNRLSLLAGLLDTDGYYYQDGNVFEITQKRKRLAKQIKFLCDTLGFKASITEKVATCGSYKGKVYRIVIGGDLDAIPTKVERKKAKCRSNTKYAVDWRVSGIKIEKDIFDTYYGFTIDGDGLFLLEDMTVTHNTTWALQAITKASTPEAKGVIVSIETPRGMIQNRLAMYESGVSWRDIKQKMKSGLMTMDERDRKIQRLIRGYSIVNEMPLLIRDKQGLTPDELRRDIEMLLAREKIGPILIDHMGKMIGKGKDKFEQVSNVSKELSSIALEYNIPIIAICQLSRAIEKQERKDKRPIMSDLRQSGEIEEDARVILGLYRDSYYTNDKLEGLTQLIVMKNNEGDAKFVIPFHADDVSNRLTPWPDNRMNEFEEYMKNKEWLLGLG